MLSAPKAAVVLARYAQCCPELPPETWDPRLGGYRKLTPGEIAKGRKHLRREQLRAMNRPLRRRRFAI